MGNNSVIQVTRNGKADRRYFSPSKIGLAIRDTLQVLQDGERALIYLRPADFTNSPINVPEDIYILAYPGAELNWNLITGEIQNVVDLNALGGISPEEFISASFVQP